MDGTLPMFRALFAASLLCATSAFAETPVRVADSTRGPSQTQAQIAAEAKPVSMSVRRDIAEWQRLRSGTGNFDAALAFLDRKPDWPGLKRLRREMEATLPIGQRPDDVLRFFGDASPQTGRGARALIAAHRARGDLNTTHDLAILTWRTMIMTQADERALLNAYGAKLADHHQTRLDMLLWRDAPKAAERMFAYVSPGWQKLARARMALRDDKNGVDTLIEAVPQSLQSDPGLAFERMQWRARKGRSAEAMAVIYAASPDALGQPQMWAGWRRSFARSEMRAGRTVNAYELASEHGLTEGAHFADLEWLAGYIALTYKKDGATAVQHFQRFRGAVETPISLGRAGYWEGRAHEAQGDAESAALAYAFGAEYQTSFYGLLAAERLGRTHDPALAQRVAAPHWSDTPLGDNSVFQAARYFVQIGDQNRAEHFLRHLTETLPKELIASLGDFVLSQNEPHLAVMIGKQAARRGIVIPHVYYPVTSLGQVQAPIERALSLAIARRESEFDPGVQSGAGAKGLMQLMPATAKAVARDLNIRYEHSRLLTDPAYNARLGNAYLDELMETFDGNIIMVAAGYNAGPGRPLRWMDRLGDPTRGQIDIVDWIEHMPFDETRNYVMRVSESLPVYRAQLTGKIANISFRDEITGRPGHTRTATKGNFLRPKARPTARSAAPATETAPSRRQARPRPRVQPGNDGSST